MELKQQNQTLSGREKSQQLVKKGTQVAYGQNSGVVSQGQMARNMSQGDQTQGTTQMNSIHNSTANASAYGLPPSNNLKKIPKPTNSQSRAIKTIDKTQKQAQLGHRQGSLGTPKSQMPTMGDDNQTSVEHISNSYSLGGTGRAAYRNQANKSPSSATAYSRKKQINNQKYGNIPRGMALDNVAQGSNSMYTNFQTHNPYSQTIPSTNRNGQKLRPKTTTLRPNQRFKNSNSFATINHNSKKGKNTANSGNLTFVHGDNMMFFPQPANLDAENATNKDPASFSEMAQRQPQMPNSINRLNLKSAHPTSNEHSIGVEDVDVHHRVVSQDNNNQLEGTESQNQIFHVNSLIKQSQIQIINDQETNEEHDELNARDQLETYEEISAANQNIENHDRRNDGAITQQMLMKKSMGSSIDQLVHEKPLHSSSKKRSMSRKERVLSEHNTIQYFQTTNNESERNYDKHKLVDRNNFRSKRNTMMLPSNFQRTKEHLQTIEMSHMGFDDSKSQTTAGPADYNIERVIGKKKIAQAGIKAVPHYSFTRTKTHRTAKLRETTNPSLTANSYYSRSALRPYGRAGNQNFVSIEPGSSGYAYGSRNAGGDVQMYFKTDDLQNPGVGDYNYASSKNFVQSKSPKATIGRSQRFHQPCRLISYADKLPAQYIKDAQKCQATPAKLGTFGNEKRWGPPLKSPGVGDYDLTNFKNFAKASETAFEIPQPTQYYKKVGQTRAKSAQRTQSTAMRTFDARDYVQNNTDRKRHDQKTNSKSPIRVGTLSQRISTVGGSPPTRKLGGPQNQNTNYMNNASRFQRTLLFVKENESALLNTLGPGPAEYETHSRAVEKARFGSKNKFTIPKSSRNISLQAASRLQADQRKTPISYCDPETQLNLMKKTGSKPIIGNYKQRFDVKKMNPVNSALWKKGVIF